MTRILDLPPEILNNIFDYLISTADPKKPQSWDRHEVRQPLNRLALVSREFRDHVEAYCAHQIAQLAARTKTSLPLHHCRKPRTYRKHYLRRVIYHCEFCQVKTSCRAMVFNDIVCCRSCDRKIWPEKMTKTAARTTYDLHDHQLAKIQSGRYQVYGMISTMYLTSDVKKLAESIHGNLEEWKKKKKERLKRQREIREEEERANYEGDFGVDFHAFGDPDDIDYNDYNHEVLADW